MLLFCNKMKKMKKNIIALDLGKGSLGLAISRSGSFITPLKNIRFHALDYRECIKLFLKEIENETIEHICVGYPTYPSGDPCEMTPIVLAFVELIKPLFPNVDINLVDERNSTVEASDILSSNNKNSKKQKKNIDSIAATVILDRYLKSINQG